MSIGVSISGGCGKAGVARLWNNSGDEIEVSGSDTLSLDGLGAITHANAATRGDNMSEV
jgi:hypothetical protein